MSRGKRVLVIDDSPLTLKVVASTLERAGFEVRATSDIASLRETFGSWRPELILTDVDMPDISGVELCRKLKASYDSAHVPVVLYSSRSEETLAELARECEADAFLSKSRGVDALPTELAYLIDTALF
jgi:two-component system, chemotaxis family, sensor kinase CheA